VFTAVTDPAFAASLTTRMRLSLVLGEITQLKLRNGRLSPPGQAAASFWSMIRKSGIRLSEKIVLEQQTGSIPRVSPSSRIRVFFGTRFVTNQMVRSKGLHYRV
jgi:hypothetical protein